MLFRSAWICRRLEKFYDNKNGDPDKTAEKKWLNSYNPFLNTDLIKRTESNPTGSGTCRDGREWRHLVYNSPLATYGIRLFAYNFDYINRTVIRRNKTSHVNFYTKDILTYGHMIDEVLKNINNRITYKNIFYFDTKQVNYYTEYKLYHIIKPPCSRIYLMVS